VLVLISGVWSYQGLNTSLFPNVTFPKIKIIANNGDQPVEKMMVAVTKPLENAIKKVENIQLIRSTTSMGSCEISAFMDWNSDINLDKQQVESQIASIKISLPADVEIIVEKMNPSILPVMGYSLQSKTKNGIELKLIAEYIVKPYLSRIAGVSSVEVIGGKEKEYRVVLDKQKLKFLRISPQDVANAFQQTDFINSTGYISDYNRLYLTVTDATIKSKEQLENLVISDDAMRKIKISDIAKVEIAERKEYVRIKADGHDVPLIAVLKQPNSNLVGVSQQVAAKVAELNNLLPEGVSLQPYYNQAEFVNKSIRSIIDVLWLGLVLSIVVIMLFLRSLKASAVILITIPLTLALTFTVMAYIGFDFNIMTIGAIAASIGLIIDDAIIVLEQIHRTHEESPERKPQEIVGKSIRFLFPSMVSSSLSTIVILIPFQLMSGVAGAYFKILTETMIITLLCSFFITWLGLPVIYLLFSSDKPKLKKANAHTTQKKAWIGFFITKPSISFIFVLTLVASIIIFLPKLPTGFLPDMDEGSIVLDFNSPPGTSLEETDRMLNVVDAIIEKIPEVKNYSRRIGTQMGFFITEPNRGDYLIELNHKRSRSTEEVSNEIRMKVKSAVPALTADFGQVITDMLGDLMSSAQPVEIKIFGDENQKLKELAMQIADSVAKVNGTADVFDGIVIAGPLMKSIPKEDKLKQYGLNPRDLQAQIETIINGVVVGVIPEKEQLTDIRMTFPEKNQLPLQKIKEMEIYTTAGDFVKLSAVADFFIQEGVSEINRENLQTIGVVTSRLNNRDLGSVIKDIKVKLKKISLPPAYQIEYGGSYAQQQQSFAELLKILILGTLLVFTVVLFMFKSLKLSLLVLFISTIGIGGGVIALFLTHTALNVGSYTGLIMIVGIIAENSIFTIQKFYTELKESSVADALKFAIAARLRPNLMTALGAIVALFPLALGLGAGAQMHQPLAIAVIGGLAMALPLLLIALPSFLKLIIKKQNTPN
jgi:CzcA family heavy metal efflux pump